MNANAIRLENIWLNGRGTLTFYGVNEAWRGKIENKIRNITGGRNINIYIYINRWQYRTEI